MPFRNDFCGKNQLLGGNQNMIFTLQTCGQRSSWLRETKAER